MIEVFSNIVNEDISIVNYAFHIISFHGSFFKKCLIQNYDSHFTADPFSLEFLPFHIMKLFNIFKYGFHAPIALQVLPMYYAHLGSDFALSSFWYNNFKILYSPIFS